METVELTEAELEAAASACMTIRRVHQIREFVGAGRSAELSDSDVTHLTALLGVSAELVDAYTQIAFEAELIDSDEEQIWALEDPHDDLDLWFSLFEGLAGMPDEEVADDLDEPVDMRLLAAGLLLALRNVGSTPKASLLDTLTAEIEADGDLAELEKPVLAELVDTVLNELALLGAVSVQEGVVSITALGAWGLQELAADSVGELLSATVAELLGAAAEMPTERADAEIDLWLQEYGLEAFVPELGGVTVGRGLAIRALLRRDDGLAAVKALDPASVWGPYVLVSLVEAGEVTLAPESADVLVALLAAVADTWGDGAVAGWGRRLVGADLERHVQLAWRVPGAATSVALTALATAADKKLAKLARASLFKWRSAV